MGFVILPPFFYQSCDFFPALIAIAQFISNIVLKSTMIRFVTVQQIWPFLKLINLMFLEHGMFIFKVKYRKCHIRYYQRRHHFIKHD